MSYVENSVVILVNYQTIYAFIFGIDIKIHLKYQIFLGLISKNILFNKSWALKVMVSPSSYPSLKYFDNYIIFPFKVVSN